MAESVIVSQAEAVLDAVKAMTGLVLTFDIERNYADFDIELPDLSALRLDVSPVRHVTAEMETRGHIGYETEIDVCIRRKFAEDDQDPDQRLSIEAIDRLVKFTENVHAQLVAAALADENDSLWSDAKLLWCPNKKHLRENSQFTGLIRLTYQTSKTIP